MRNRGCQTPIQDMVELRRRFFDTWSGFSQSIMDDTMDKRRKRLQAWVDAKEDHFEHLLSY